MAMSDVSLVISDSPEPGISVLTLNRPKARNALSKDMLAALQGATDSVSADPAAKTVIIKANGPGFCAGHDLKEMTDHRKDADKGEAYYKELFAACSHLMLSINRSPKIFIASVHGVAAAAGCQLVAACDLAVAADHVSFGVNGINSGLFCSTPMVALSRSVGRKKSMELLTTGDLMPAPDAVETGLINKAVPAEALEGTTLAMARSIAAKPADVLALGKTAFYKQLTMPITEAYDFASSVITDNMLRPAAVEGINAFIEKRTPEWDG